MAAEIPMLDCEGGGCPPNAHPAVLLPTVATLVLIDSLGLCAMCGQIQELDDAGLIPAHQRVDVLAMIDSGDFDD